MAYAISHFKLLCVILAGRHGGKVVEILIRLRWVIPFWQHVVCLDNLLHVRLELIDSWLSFLNHALFGKVFCSKVSLLTLNGEIVDFAAANFLYGFSLCEWLLSCLLWGNYLGVIQVNLVHSVVQVCAIELPINKLSDLIIAHEITTLMLSDQFIYLGIHCHIVLSKFLSELLSINCPWCVFL